MKFDDVLRHIGEFGPYQKRIYLLVCLPSILVGFEALSTIFIFYRMPHRCAIPSYPGDTYNVQNDTHAMLINSTIPRTNGKMDECHVRRYVSSDAHSIHNQSVKVSYNISSQLEKGFMMVKHDNGTGQTYEENGVELLKCESWVYDHSLFTSTATSDLDVVCDNLVQRSVSNMIAEIGAIVGAFVSGLIADRFGRKTAFYLGGISLLAGGMGIAFTYNLVTFNICRFIVGLARVSVFSNGVVLGMELVGPSKRMIAGLAIDVIWILGGLLLGLFAYFIRNWRYLEIALSVPAIGLLFYWWLLPESPRWLASRGREDEAIKVLEKIAHSNKRQLPKVAETESLLEGKADLGFSQVFRSRELIKRTIILASSAFVVIVTYFALTLNITNLSGDLFVNYSLNMVVELIGYTAPIYFVHCLGRKPVYGGSIIIAGCACVVSIFPLLFGAPVWIVLALSITGRLFISAAFAVTYLYGAELFPTAIRASTMSVVITISRVGGVLSPYIADVGILIGGRFQQAIPLVVMGTPAILVGLLALLLPETRGTRLPDTIEDVEQLEGTKCFCCREAGPQDSQELEVSVNDKEPKL